MAKTKPEVPGQIAHIDAKGRLAVPAALARVLGWDAVDGSVAMLVDLNAEERLQIFRLGDMADELKALRERLRAQAEDADNYDALRAFEDRYREATLYREGFRIALTVEIRAFLLDNWKGRIPVYVEVSDNRLVVMSRRARQQRLADLADGISLD